jgi:HEAT repeat protein
MKQTMHSTNLETAALGTGIAAAAAGATAATHGDELIARIQSRDDEVSTAAWQSAALYGAPAIKPLAALLTSQDFELARRARHALYKIVRHANRPGARAEARAVESELLSLLEDPGTRREGLWLLSEIGGDRAVEPMAALLSDKDCREDARCALLRIPGEKVTAALRKALATAPEDFRYALADSLRARGGKVEGYPSRKMVPTAKTSVEPAAAKS